MIPAGSVEEQLIADTIESGGSIKNTTDTVNEYRIDTLGAILVGETCVSNAIHRLNPDMRKVAKKPCGGNNSLW